jgi:hypothetical protein
LEHLILIFTLKITLKLPALNSNPSSHQSYTPNCDTPQHRSTHQPIRILDFYQFQKELLRARPTAISMKKSDPADASESSIKMMPDGAEPALEASLHRFLVSEVRSVRFGPREDASTTIISIFTGIGAVYLGVSIWGTLSFDQEYRKIMKSFLMSNQFIAALLLFAWILTYNIISLTIYHQFEVDERYPSDDFYIVSTVDGDADDPRYLGSSMVQGELVPPVIVQMPDEQVVLALATDP